MTMIDLNQISHHPVIDELVTLICNKTQNIDRGFYDVEVAYFLGKMAASMRVNLVTQDRGEIPVNIYALALAQSGMGKGYSIGIMEDEVLAGFKTRFMSETFPVIADDHMFKLATFRSVRDSTNDSQEKDKLDREFKDAGALAFTFDSATPAAIKQLRHKLLLANCGAINLQIDEIGSNLIGSTEALNVFLELYDKGTIKQKLTKNTKENVRAEEIDGKTPTNALLFGTPTKLLDGGSTEDHFYSFLETGYARRCLFGLGQKVRGKKLTPEETYKRLTDPANKLIAKKWHDHFTDLADPNRYGWKINVDEAIAVELIRYKNWCEEKAALLPDNEEIMKSELEHRYFKCLKLAGAFAFIDEAMDLDMTHFYQAMKIVEASGEAFTSILKRDKTYAKLAKFLANVKTEQTHADLNLSLPFYKSSQASRNELMTLATAWGYKNNIIIKKTFSEGIEFFTGETLEQTDLEAMTISYSDHVAFHYRNERVKFEDMPKLFGVDGYGWSNHHFTKGHRTAENTIQGFDMLVLDIDEGTPLALVHELMKEYKFMTYTTKRHQTEGYGDRFRLILPMNYRLVFDATDYEEFMNNVLNWLPFKVDDSANQRERKWSCNGNTQIFYNPGKDDKLVDVLKFIPKTSRNEQYNKDYQAVANMDNLGRWFASNMSQGNRNNLLFRFGSALVDGGVPFSEVENRIMHLNSQLQEPLSDEEIRGSVLVSVAKKVAA